MRRGRFAASVIFASVLAVQVLGEPAHAGDVFTVEDALLELVNEGRPVNELIVHPGLRVLAREHSESLSKLDALSHLGAASRFEEAEPSPEEANGAPDDGFTDTWCENVAVARGGTADEVARLIYDGWKASPPHHECMMNPVTTVAGVGVHFDGHNWWATLDAVEDRTLPDAAPTAEASLVPSTPAPPTVAPAVPAPAVTAKPELAVAAARADVPADEPAMEQPPAPRGAERGDAVPVRNAAATLRLGAGLAIAAAVLTALGSRRSAIRAA